MKIDVNPSTVELDAVDLDQAI